MNKLLLALLFLITVFNMQSQERMQSREQLLKLFEDTTKYKIRENGKDYLAMQIADDPMITNIYIFDDDDYCINVVISPKKASFESCKLFLNGIGWIESPRWRAWSQPEYDLIAYILYDWKQKEWFISYYKNELETKGLMAK